MEVERGVITHPDVSHCIRIFQESAVIGCLFMCLEEQASFRHEKDNILQIFLYISLLQLQYDYSHLHCLCIV